MTTAEFPKVLGLPDTYVKLPFERNEDTAYGTFTSGTVYWYPLPLAEATSVATFTCLVGGTGGSSGAVARFAVRQDDNGQPGTLLLDAGTVAVTSANGYRTVTLATPQALPIGLWWIGVVPQGSPVTPASLSAAAGDITVPTLPGGSLSETGSGNHIGFTETGVTGAFATQPGTLTRRRQGTNASVHLAVVVGTAGPLS